MSTQLHIIDQPDDIKVAQGIPPAGSLWRFPEGDRDGRECWCIVLPNAAGIWQTTERAAISGPPFVWGGMWEVSGEAPDLTVSPSINAGDGPEPGNWHGWIRSGVMEP